MPLFIYLIAKEEARGLPQLFLRLCLKLVTTPPGLVHKVTVAGKATSNKMTL